MIIRYPTALYGATIPQQPSDGGNVTYTISMDDPPRDQQVITRLPPAVEARAKPDSELTPDERKANLGDHLYTMSKARGTDPGSSKKQFEVGQVLEFASGDEPTINPMLVSSGTELRHDTNRLDLEGLGISDPDADLITSKAETQLKELQVELNGYRRERANTEVEINENKKSQNEAEKALSAVRELLKTDSSLQPIVDDLELKIDTLTAEAVVLVDKANTAASNASDVLQRSRDVAQLVR